MNARRFLRSLFAFDTCQNRGKAPESRVALQVEVLEERCLLDANPPAAAIPEPIVGQNPYWTQRELANYYQSFQGHTHVVFLGDSVTDAYASAQGGIYPQTGAPFFNMYMAPLGAVDFGVAGFQTSQVLWQVDSGEVANMTPDVVVLNIGTNNLYFGQSAEDTFAGIQAIVSQLRAQLPHTHIVLMGLLPLGATPTDSLRQAVAQLNPMIATLADGNRVTYTDLASYFLQSDGTWNPALTVDTIHPTVIGYGYYTLGLWGPVTEALLAAEREAAAFGLPQL
jgi:lysophospholipase L1-like esterase